MRTPWTFSAALLACVIALGACGNLPQNLPQVWTSTPVQSPATGTNSTQPTTQLPEPTATGATAEHKVVRVIDGDTVELADGNRVRLIGIDTPERDQCGYMEASSLLRSLVQDRSVRLVSGARTDTDRYGRLLRYLEMDGKDINLEMLLSGRAIARYDSRDGYGYHPREDVYVLADSTTATTDICPAR
jgi:endonuclease YncB( thermonuclease family)